MKGSGEVLVSWVWRETGRNWGDIGEECRRWRRNGRRAIEYLYGDEGHDFIVNYGRDKRRSARFLAME